MAVQVVSLVNYAITLTNPAYVLKPFESKIFTAISAITSDLAAKDALKILQAEVITPINLDDGGGQARVTAENDAQAKALVPGTLASAAVATEQGTAIGDTRRISDGANQGAIVMWAIPSGASSPTWCWWLWPQSAF